ncbi:MAG: FAD-binding protein, partial [Candidatus Margulisbacteria bacterium]|nr:FAD-binding protein [Candidatus Margulisiibacteriota bacterium]
EGAHSERRILHSGDSTGKEIEKVLIQKCKTEKNIKIYEDTQALELLVENNNCFGAICRSQNILKTFLAKTVFIATGGIAHIFLQSTHPFVCTGDGIAMAYRAGAALENMEFIQFHPTTLYAAKTWQRTPLFLISEAVRGEGAVLKNVLGESFMKKYHTLGDLAPRDIVARAIVKEMKDTLEDRVFLDFSKVKSDLKKRFPTIYQKCKEEGYDISDKYLPVAPAAHYLMGGIKVDLNGKASIKNLYAIGEAASTGVHGANRLASNSLLEGLVFGIRAAKAVINNVNNQININEERLANIIEKQIKKYSMKNKISDLIRNKIQKIMWFKVGIIRSGASLKEALSELNSIEEKGLDAETKNILLLAKIVTTSALKRKESRGAHYRLDNPKSRLLWKRSLIVKKSKVKNTI